MSLTGQKFRVTDAKTEAEALVVQSADRNLLCFANDTHAIVLGGVKYGGSSVEVDTSLDTGSTNPVQNQVVASAIKKLNDKLFPLTVKASGGGTYEQGTKQTVKVGWTVTDGTNAVTPDSLTIQAGLTGNKVAATTAELSQGYKTFSNVSASILYTVEATKDGMTDSDTARATFVYASYYGAVASGWTATEANVKALTKSVKATKAFTTAKTALSNQLFAYAYPQSFGELTQITDGGGVNDYRSSFTRTDDVTVNGQKYYIYILSAAVTVTDFIFKFA